MKNYIKTSGVVVLVLLFSSTVFASDISMLQNIQDVFSEVASEVKPAVVNISTERTVKLENPFKGHPFENILPFNVPDNYKAQSLGSGIVIDGEKGYIITNNHVIKGAEEIKIMVMENDNDTYTYEGELVGSDTATELAVIKIKDLEGKVLKEAKLGDSDELEVGHWVLAIGNPFQYNQSVSFGIVSALSRSNYSPMFRDVQYQDFIQTDAAINPGNSGGPLVNLKGEVIGINTYIATQGGGSEGVGFAIPVNLAKPVAKGLIEKGKVDRGYLGVRIDNVTEDIKDSLNMPDLKGAIVTVLLEDGPAKEAGIETDDVIVEVDNIKVNNPGELMQTIANIPPDTKIKLKVFRPKDEEFKTITIKLGTRPSEIALSGKPSGDETILGLTLKNITPELAQQYELSDDEGVVILKIDSESNAAKTSVPLEPGDIIVGVDWKPVKTVKDFVKAVEDAKKEVEKGDNKNKIMTRVKKKSGVYKYITIELD